MSNLLWQLPLIHAAFWLAVPEAPPPASQPAAAVVPADPCDCQALHDLAAAAPRDDRAAALLTAARCILTCECAPLVSRELAGDAAARPELAQSARRARKLINAANKALPPDAADQRVECVELLGAFADTFEALADAADADTDASREQLVSACNTLALYLDDSREALVESVKLWQGVVYRRAKRPDRSLQVLRPFLSRPAAPRIGFLARVERCRALADQGAYAAAIALELKLKDRVGDWLGAEPEATRAQALQCLDALHRDLYAGWAAKLREQGNADQADQIEKQFPRAASAPALSTPVFMLEEAVAQLPQCRTPASEPAETTEADETAEADESTEPDETAEPDGGDPEPVP